jgi:flagellin-like protein
MNGGPLRRRTFRPDDRGVSPVVGTVLVLVIMIMAIGGIMAWGVPAINGLQERAEYQSVLTQFLQMESDVRGLRDPQNTRISQLSISDGRIVFDAGDRWVVIGMQDPDGDYDPLYLGGWEGSDPETITIQGLAFVPPKIIVDKVQGGTFETVWSCGPTPACSNMISMGIDPGDPNNLAIGAHLDTHVVRIQFLEGSGAKAEAWIYNVGHLAYRLTERNEQNRLHFAMGAVFSQHDDFYYLEQAPTVKDPDYEIEPRDTSLFIRMLQLSGTMPQGVGGRGQFPIVYHLVDNYGSARGRPSFDPATAARIQIHGPLEVPFCNYFDRRDHWAQEAGGVPAACATDPNDWDGPSNVNLRFTRPTIGGDVQSLIFDMSHSVVTTRVRTS